MADGTVNPEKLSARQLWVAAFVAGLSPAAAVAGEGNWLWMFLWSAAGLALGCLVLRRVGNRPLFRGRAGGVPGVLYRIWAVVLTARVLDRAASRLEATSGGSPKFWLLILVTVPLIWMCWGKSAPFFRMVEIFWPAMAVVLALVLGFGLAKVDWWYAVPAKTRWFDSVTAAAEILTSALFILPYIYKVGGEKRGRGLIFWLGGLALVSAALSAVTVGILGAAAAEVRLPFFVAAGTLGKTARCEGLLSALWLISDLTMAGLLCRVWGGHRWPALAAVLAAVVALSGVCEWISREIYAVGSLALLVSPLLFPGKKAKIVVTE